MRFVLTLALIALFAWLVGRAVNFELARASQGSAVKVGLRAASPSAVGMPTTYQGRGVRWWARRAVQARRDANARGRTIRRLQATVRARLDQPTGNWLDGAFLCLYRHERGRAGWQTDTSNGYRGGLQMDAAFSYTYGPAWAKRQWGTNPAHWPAAVQMSAAMHAWTTRGFAPWPTTRRYCGL